MSDFSSWGVSPDMRLKPEVTAPGGNIYSSVPGGGYKMMSWYVHGNAPDDRCQRRRT